MTVKTGELVKIDPAVSRIEEMIGANKDRMAALLGKNVSVERLFQIALTAVSRIPKLKECTTSSVLGCVMESSRLRLAAGSGAGGTWLIPRNNKNLGAMECTMIVDYRAIILMMKRDAGVEIVIAEKVCIKDDFSYGINASGPYINWKPASGDRGAILGYVAASWNKTKALTGVIYKTVAEIDLTSKSKSMAGSDGPWNKDPEWMYKKSVIRPLAKLNPGTESDDLSRAIALDERAELGLPQNLHLLADPNAKAQEEEIAKKTYATPPETKKDESSNDAQAIAWVRTESAKKGVSVEQFDAWLAQQVGDETVKSKAAKDAWKRVVAKEKATDVFSVEAPKDADSATSGKLSFKVYSVATTEFFGEDAFVIKSAGEEIKNFTQDEKIAEAAKAAKKSDSVFEINYREIEREGKTYRWIVSVA